MDMTTIAKLVRGEPGKLRLRQAEVTAVAVDGTLSVKIGGSGVVVAGARAFDSVSASVGSSVWLVTDGVDLIAIGRVGAAPYCAVGASSAQSLPSAALTVASWGIEERDPFDMFRFATPDRIICVQPGMYHLSVSASIQGSTAGGRYLSLNVTGVAIARTGGAPRSDGFWSGNAATVAILSVGDYVTASLWQNAGATLTTYASHMRLAAAFIRGDV